MHVPSQHAVRLLVALVLAAAVSLPGCAAREDTSPSSTSSAPTSSAPTDVASSQDSGTSGTPGSSGSDTESSGVLQPKDAAAIGQQLDAIERELESLGMPSDSDFKAIEDSLR